MPSDIFMSCNRPKNCGSEYTHTTASEQNTKTRFYLTLIHLSISKGGGGASINSHFMFSYHRLKSQNYPYPIPYTPALQAV